MYLSRSASTCQTVDVTVVQLMYSFRPSRTCLTVDLMLNSLYIYQRQLELVDSNVE